MSDSDENKEDQEIDFEAKQKEIEDKLWESFMSFDKEGSGYIECVDVKFVLEMMGLKFTEAEMFKMISDLDPQNNGQISYNDFKPSVVDREMARIKGSDDNELMDAFVAMGGDGNGGGCVDA